jgi:transcriptional regulator with XRE-family HTH domain
MATRETRLQVGRRTGEARLRAVIAELAAARRSAGISQRTIAGRLERSQAQISRLERCVNPAAVSVLELAEVAALLGLELSVGLHPAGQPIRDKGHQALVNRFRRVLGDGWAVASEAPFPSVGDPRTWDLLLRLPNQRVGVECETRIRDIQALARRIHQRQRDGGAHVVVLALNDSAVNRRLLPDLSASLGPTFAQSPRLVLRALRSSEPLPGSAVICL